ncbi:MAG: hypothetical protein SOX50_08495 [Terrisporobacter othiniensis]|uniref:hypothetical protein n=1 Tax=Terrisporobacter othiniensis TaxID=1577792 RepID=UPI002A74ECB6|nr:hypothetical protein [Terrisporobacter othiniensis]MDY3373296.1 hypothetical protein [Terrisporobacter othiniensis]
MNNQGSRAERRAMLAKAKKKAEFAKSLTPLQQEYIDEIKEAIRERTKIEMIASLDVAVTGALIKYTELTLEEIFDVNVTIGKYLGEIKNIERKMNSEERIMKIKAIEKEVAQIVCEMVIEGKERKDVVKAVREKFKGTGLTTAEINVAYKRACEQYKNIKEEWKEESEKAVENIKSVLGECDKETKDALEYIFAEDTKETQNKARIEEKEVEQANIPVDEEKINTSKNKGDKKMSKLKVIKEVTKVVSRDVEGEYGIYHIEGNVVNINDEYAFTNSSEVKNWASETRKELAEKLEKIKTEIRHINMCEAEALEVIETYM